MRISAWILGALGLAGAGMAQQSGMFRIIFSSEGETAFVATCEITHLGQVEERLIEDKAPLELTIAGGSLSCQIEAAGPLTVEVIGPRGTRSRTQTSGGVLSLSLS